MDYMVFRSNALSGLAMLRPKDKRFMQSWSKDDVEAWVKREYDRHYPKIAQSK